MILGHSSISPLAGANALSMSTTAPNPAHGHDLARRASSSHSSNTYALEDRFEVLKEIGDGSFGSVVLARVRSAGSNVARRGTVVSFVQARKLSVLGNLAVPLPPGLGPLSVAN